VDYIGVDAYYKLTNSNNPSLETLKTAWNNRADAIETWRNSNWPNMEIIFTEAGYQSVDGTNQSPWYTDPSTHGLDMQEQADCYEALLSQCRHRVWWRGIFWWNWETNPDSGGPDDPYWTPRNKSAEFVMRKHAIELSYAVVILQTLAGMVPFGISSAFVASGADLDGDGIISLEELIYVLQFVSGMS